MFADNGETFVGRKFVVRKADLVALIEAGCKPAEITALYGAERTAFYAWCRRFGLPARFARREVNRDSMQALIESATQRKRFAQAINGQRYG